jgi:hypothetical protein
MRPTAASNGLSCLTRGPATIPAIVAQRLGPSIHVHILALAIPLSKLTLYEYDLPVIRVKRRLNGYSNAGNTPDAPLREKPPYGLTRMYA